MNLAPTLILQWQRMGDIVLSFPLLGWLRKQQPERPLWVVAEPHFFEGLLPLGPEAVYFPPDAAPQLAAQSFHTVINLSHRPEAAALAGSLNAEHVFGPCTVDGVTTIHGAWQLYRASLVHNNRHNRFHWADLNALDCIPPQTMLHTAWPMPQPAGSGGRVGLFVGASEQEKRPHPAFWGALAKGLVRRGLRPVFLGGPGEVELGAAAAAEAGLPGSNLCGHFALPELVTVLRTLDLLVTPDTGPMHVAAWAGVPTLNLSMGPVNAWETAPAMPGHYVVRATVSCVGCWRCTQPTVLCRDRFNPTRVASLVHMLMRHQGQGLDRIHMPGLSLLRTTRDDNGLFALTPLQQAPPTPRQLLAIFWQQWFMHHLQSGATPHCAQRAPLQEAAPALTKAMLKSAAQLGRTMALHLRKGGTPLTADFWSAHPPLLRPLTGYLHLLLQNSNYTRAAWAQALELVESLAAACSTTR